MKENEKENKWRSRIQMALLLTVSALIGFLGAPYLGQAMVNLPFWYFFFYLLIFIFSFPLHIILHEIGHLIGGKLSGYEFIMFRLFGTVWIQTENGLSKRKQTIPGLLGQALMVPPEGLEQPPFLLYHSSGLIINLLTSALFVFIGRAVSHPLLSGSLYISAIVAFLIFLTNAWPNKGNDGYNIRQLYKDPSTLDEMTNLLFIYSGLVKGETFTALNEYIDLKKMDSFDNPNTITFYTMKAAYYYEQLDFENARSIYAKLWNNIDQLLPAHKPEVTINYLFTLFLTEPNHPDISEVKQSKLYNDYVKPHHREMSKVLAAEAIYMDNNFARAEEYLSEGEKKIHLMPTISEERLETKLYQFLRDEIQRLEAAEISEGSVH